MNNYPREGPVSQQPPFSAPYEQYGSQAEVPAPPFYQVPPPTGQYIPPGTPGLPSAPAPGWVTPTPVPPAPVGAPYYYPPPYAPPFPATPDKKHTARNITLIAIVLCLLIGGIIGLFAFLIPHKALTTHVSTGLPTATANVVDQYPSYLPGHGNLAIDDPLQYANNWNDSSTGHCIFMNNAYHVRSLTNNVLYNCYVQSNNAALKNATNSAFETHMTVVQGDCGGLAIRASLSDFGLHYKFYYLSICQDGNYGIFKYNISHQGSDTVRSFAYSAAIKQGINQENIVDMVAMGSTLSMFVNGQQIANVQDSSLTQGTFGLGVNPGKNNISEVVYHEAKIWTL